MKFCTFLAAAVMVAVVSGDDTNEKVQTKKSKRKNCAALGYTDSLMCSNCDKMVEYFDSVELGADGDVKDLYAECNECCSSSSGSDGTVGKNFYTKAFLQGKFPLFITPVVPFLLSALRKMSNRF